MEHVPLFRGYTSMAQWMNTGLKIRFASDCGGPTPPNRYELHVLRDLKARIAAHAMPAPVV